MDTSKDSSFRVAIIGRPNVGKSTLFNRLIGQRKSVVKNRPGVTRDILIETAELWGKSFEVLDTGGLTESQDLISELIFTQVSQLLGTVDLLVLVMDGKTGVTPEDREVYRLAKASGTPFVIFVNKLDALQDTELLLSEFYEFEAPIFGASLEQHHGFTAFLEDLHARIPSQHHEIQEGLKIAFVGKPNAGKSQLVNALLGEPRVLVSPEAGTTVDSVDIPFVLEGRQYTLIDTAGLRKSARQEDDIEIIASFKTQDAIRRADLLFLVIDATLGPSQQDAKILELILEEHKMAVVVANKIDLFNEGGWKQQFLDKVEQVFHFYRDIPIVFTSALTRKGLKDLTEKIRWAEDKIYTQIPTSELNDFFFEAIRQAPAPVWGTTNVKFYYLTQTKQKPPAFIAFANHPDGVDTAYRRFLINKLKERFDLWGVPIRIFVLKSGKN
jgi:GTP-binding protein